MSDTSTNVRWLPAFSRRSVAGLAARVLAVLTLLGLAPHFAAAQQFVGKTAPASGTMGQSPSVTLSWGTNPSAFRYEYCLGNIVDNDCGGSWTSAGLATSVTVTGLGYSTAYYWQVRAALFLTEPTPHTEYVYGDSGTWWCFATREGLRTDFDGDGRSDVLWHHATRGEVWLWTMNGAARVSETYVRTEADTDWEIRGLGDQTGEGMADILWWNKLTGMVYFWPMDGSTPLEEVYVATVDPAYDIVGTGDFNGDGKADILWRNPTVGDVWIWLMDGATMLSEVYVDTVDPGYLVKGVGDLDADLKADLVWHGAAGDVWVWLMNGTTRLSQHYVGTVPDTTYQIQQVADFDGNGNADLLWWNTVQGDAWIWPMDGTIVLSESYVGVVPDTNYRIMAAGDYDGNGKADILWRNIVQGDVWVWLMNGTVKLSEHYVGTVPDLGYQIE